MLLPQFVCFLDDLQIEEGWIQAKPKWQQDFNSPALPFSIKLEGYKSQKPHYCESGSSTSSNVLETYTGPSLNSVTRVACNCLALPCYPPDLVTLGQSGLAWPRPFVPTSRPSLRESLRFAPRDPDYQPTGHSDETIQMITFHHCHVAYHTLTHNPIGIIDCLN